MHGSLADAHQSIAAQADDDCRQRLDQVKAPLGSKTAKEATKAFQSAQAVWEKKRVAVNTAAKKWRKEEAQARKKRSSITEKQKAKIKEAKSKLDDAITDMYTYRPKYEDAMAAPYNRLDGLEQARAGVFRDGLERLHSAGEIQTKVANATARVKRAVDAIAPEDDAMHFSNRYGLNQPIEMPVSNGRFAFEARYSFNREPESTCCQNSSFMCT